MSAFATIEEGIEEIRQGRILLVVDDEDRENEGDLVMAADKVTPEAVNFMATHGRGLICVPMTGERLDELKLGMMVTENTAPMGTAFTVTVDARRGVTTGTSAYDRAVTIRTLVDPAMRADDLTVPGHIFPLRAMDGGVLRRAGHTEAAVDLARLAGCSSRRRHLRGARRDRGHGAAARADRPGAAVHGLKMITIKDLIEYRTRKEKLVRRVASTRLPTDFGEFTAHRLRGDRVRPRAPRPGDGRRGGRHARVWCACTPSASPATSSTRCAATAARSCSRRWRSSRRPGGA